MEHIEPKITHDIPNSSGSICNMSCDIPENDQSVKVEDERIICTNSTSLDKILEIVASNVEQLAESVNLGSEKSQFVSRVLEIFKDNIQENVTINGLPYAANKGGLSSVQREEQKNEVKDALLSDLSKKLLVCAVKRQNYPKDYCRKLDKRLRCFRHNLKSAKISHTVHVPMITVSSFQGNSLPSHSLEEVIRNVKSSQTKLIDAANELKIIEKNIEFAHKLTTQRAYSEALQDTGYNSS